LIRTSFLFAGSIGSEFVIVSLGLTCMIDRCFDSRMQLKPSRNSTVDSACILCMMIAADRSSRT
jgi:hypothetical protein